MVVFVDGVVVKSVAPCVVMFVLLFAVLGSFATEEPDTAEQ